MIERSSGLLYGDGHVSGRQWDEEKESSFAIEKTRHVWKGVGGSHMVTIAIGT
jgi:hypothetical protein